MCGVQWECVGEVGMCRRAVRVQRGCSASALECVEVAVGLQRGGGSGVQGVRWVVAAG